MPTSCWKPIGLAVAVTVCGLLETAPAQTPRLPARTTTMQPPPPMAEDPLESDLERLTRLRQQLSEQLRQKAEIPLPAPLPPAELPVLPVPAPAGMPQRLTTDEAPKVSPMLDDFQSSHHDTNQRVDALRRRIEELQDVVRRAAQAHAEAAARSAAADDEEQESDEDESPKKEKERPRPAAKNPPAAPESELPQTLTGTVDRLALADSLFGSGEVLLALEIYADLLSQSPTHIEADWIHYQLACCHRRVGNRSEAEKHYRIVAGQSNAGLLAENARRWLRQVQERRQIEEYAVRLKQTRLSLQEQLNGEPRRK